MKAILLAAGMGTRLRPITNSIPKCLVPINGKPLLQFWLESLMKLGITEVLINTFYLPEQVIDFVECSAFRKNVIFYHEQQLEGTAGTLKKTLDFWKGHAVLIAHADNLCLCNFFDFISSFNHRPLECIGTMMTFKTETPRSCGIVQQNQDDVLTGFFEKVDNPPSNIANAAVFIFSWEVAGEIERLNDKESDISRHLIPKLLWRLNVWRNDVYMRDIGTQESLSKAEQDMKLN